MRKTITTTTITSLGFNPNPTKYIKKNNKKKKCDGKS
jgi:hypothetical protein